MARGGCWRGMGSEFSLVEGARTRAGDEKAGSHAKAGSCTSFLSPPLLELASRSSGDCRGRGGPEGKGVHYARGWRNY